MTEQSTISDTDRAETPDDFDAAFDQLTTGSQQSPADAADIGAGEVDALEDHQETSPPDDGGSTGQAAAGDAPADKQPSEDIWQNADPRLKAAFDELKAQSTNRERDLTTRLSNAGREIAQFRQHQVQGGAAGKQDKEQRSDPEPESEQMKRFREDYPEIAEAMDNQRAAFESQLAELKQPIDQLSQSQQVKLYSDNLAEVQNAVPDLADLVNRTDYESWVMSQPRPVQEAYQRNQAQVVDPQEAVWVLNLFKQHIGASPAPSSQQEDPAAIKTGQKRARQLDAGRDGGKGGGAPVMDQIPDDFDAAADAYAAQRARERSRR